LVSYFCQYFLFNLGQKILVQIAHNVPAVGGILPARTRALRSKDQGLTKCAGTTAWEWSAAQ
jgi:hypothetical protein